MTLLTLLYWKLPWILHHVVKELISLSIFFIENIFLGLFYCNLSIRHFHYKIYLDRYRGKYGCVCYILRNLVYVYKPYKENTFQVAYA